MSRRIVLVIPATEADARFSMVLRDLLQNRRLVAWHVDRDIRIGESAIAAIDEAVGASLALIIVRSASSHTDAWSRLVARAFRARMATETTARLLIIPQGPVILEHGVVANAHVAPAGLTPEQAADWCCLVLAHPLFDQSEYPSRRGSTINPSAWWSISEISGSYPSYVNVIGDLLHLGEYEHAGDLYWRILHYSGYREKWKERLSVSSQMVHHALKRNDRTGAADVLLHGIVYPHIERGELDLAQRALAAAAELLGNDSNLGALYWKYVAEIRLRRGMIRGGYEALTRALRMARGLEQYKIELRRDLTIAASTTGPRTLRSIDDVSGRLAEIGDYREGSAMILKAEVLLRDGDPSAAEKVALTAARFFERILMPRNVRRGYALLDRIRKA